MPCVDGKISGIPLTDNLRRELESQLTQVLQQTIGFQFPKQLGFEEGSETFEKAHRFAKRIMPGWTWITLSEATWAVRGERLSEEIVARFHILVLAGALTQQHRQQVVTNVEERLAHMLGKNGKPVHLFVDIVEGEVDMTLPEELFGDLLKGSTHRLLAVPDVVQFLKEGIE